MKRILFLCLGNICRSPLAEGAFRTLVTAKERHAEFQIDSAGTAAFHIGKPPDPRSIAEASKHGVEIASQRARQLHRDDFRRFDWIVAMDGSNLAEAEALRPKDGAARVVAFMSFVPGTAIRDVPDPYYGGDEGFGEVWQLLGAGMPHLLAAIDAAGDGSPRS